MDHLRPVISSTLLLAAFFWPAMARAQTSVDPEYLRAWQLVGQGHPDEAIPLLRSFIHSNPAFDPAYTLSAFAYHQAKRDAEGEAFFRSLVASDSNSSLDHYGLFRSLSTQGRFSEAKPELWACVHSQPALYSCYLQAAGIARQDETGEVSEEQFKGSIRFDPGQAESQLALSYFRVLTMDLDGARVAGEEAARIARGLGKSDLAAAVEFDLFEVESLPAGDVRQAARHAEESCRLARQGADLTSIFNYCGRAGSALSNAGEGEQGDAWMESLAAEAQGLRNPAAEAEVLQGVAGNMSGRGDIEGALAVAERGVALSREAQQWFLLANLLNGVGQMRMTIGDHEGAFSAFEDGVLVARLDGSPILEANLLSKLTVAYNRAGKGLEAIRAAEDAVRIFRQLGLPWQAGAEVGDVAAAYLSLGDYSSAVPYIRESQASANRIHDPLEVMRTGNELGEALLELGQLGDAVEELRRALLLAPKAQHEHFEARTRTLLGEAYSKLHQDVAAQREFGAALRLADAFRDVWLQADLLERLGYHLFRSGDLNAAESAFERCLALAEPASLPRPAQEARRGLAEIALRRNEPEQALKNLRKAVEELESLRAEAPGPEQRAGLVERNWQVYEDIVEALGRLHSTAPRAGYDREALSYVERGRARVLLDLLEESRATVRLGLTPEQAKRQSALEKQLADALAALRREDSAAHRAAADAAEHALKEWTVELRVANPQFQELKYPQPLDADGIQKAAASTGTTIFEYALGRRSSRVWAATAAGIRTAGLPPEATIAGMVRRLREAIGKRPDAATADDFRAPARQLYQVLMGPVAGQLHAGTKVVVVADGILHYLPFECLVGPDGKFLIERVSISYAPSASVFARLAVAGNSNARMELLALGNPVFGGAAAANRRRPSGDAALTALSAGGGAPLVGNAEVVRSVYSAAGMKLEPLPGTEREVRTIAALFRPNQERVLLGRAATVPRFEAEPLTNFRHVHLATHALIDERSPLRSGIVLSMDDRTGGTDAAAGEMGVLQLGEIMKLKLDSELVTLSACQTGLGTLVRGEGMVGLVRAFFFAGARRLAVSLWPVNDESTPDLMKTFYRQMRDGSAPPEALRAAKLAMLHSGTAAYRHPYFWAPFVVTGAR